MKIILFLLLTLFLISCQRETEKENSKPEDIEVMVVATPANDTTVITSTPPVQLRVR